MELNNIAASLLGVSKWISDSFPTIRLIFIILLVICSLALIIVILIQPSNSQGVGAISGQSETFFSKNKSKTLEGAMKRLTIVLSIVIFVLAILFFVSLVIYNPTGGV